MHKRTAEFLSLLLLIAPVSSHAWGPVGHKAIGMIAQSRLSAGTLKAIEAIVGPGVRLDQMANCADKLIYGEKRCADAFLIQSSTGFGTMPWHFINIPIPADVDESSLMGYCPGGENCVVAQIHKDVLILQDRNASREDQQTALMFLIHFVGDEHQPLHGSDGEPHDQGGGFKKMSSIVYQGKAVNLHSLWDSAIDTPELIDYRLPDQDLTCRAKYLAARLEIHFRGMDTSAWLQGDIASQAALESHELAKAVIYPSYAVTQGIDTLVDYESRMRWLAEERIYMAGVRLAALLERALHPVFVPEPNPADMSSSSERVRASLKESARAFE